MSGLHPGVSPELSHSILLILFVFIRPKKICAPYQLSVFHSMFMRIYTITDTDCSKIILTNYSDCSCLSWESLWKGLGCPPCSHMCVVVCSSHSGCRRHSHRDNSSYMQQPYSFPWEHRALAEGDSKRFQYKVGPGGGSVRGLRTHSTLLPRCVKQQQSPIVAHIPCPRSACHCHHHRRGSKVTA